jgi:glycine/D-amino acid oxidase-like deaminating enzyme
VSTMREPARDIPVIRDVDLCVIGGSCTGVFAAVRAARLGARVAMVEKQNCFGGVATNGLVNVWHNLQDTAFERQIIGGLTVEIIERLEKRGAVLRAPRQPLVAFRLNTEELKIELDELVRESRVDALLHASCTWPVVADGRIDAVIVEAKSGRGAIRARAFVDATGDGDVCARAGLPFEQHRYKQPPTTCAKIHGLTGLDRKLFKDLVYAHRDEFGLRADWGWGGPIPGVDDVSFHAESHVFDLDCTDTDQLTAAEIEGRRQVRAIMDIVRKYGPAGVRPVLLDLGSYIGIRETRHARCRYRLTGDDLLAGRRFDDAIANGTYPVDVHHEDKPGLTFRYLDGTQRSCRDGFPDEAGRWRPETPENPTFYQVPFRSLVPGGIANVVVAGRILDADPVAYGAVRVMVNTNQTGEAAGVAAAIALAGDGSFEHVDAALLRRKLAEGGSIIL